MPETNTTPTTAPVAETPRPEITQHSRFNQGDFTRGGREDSCQVAQ